MSRPAVSVIVVNYNSGGHLARCLAALLAQRFADFEIVIVDNDSTDGSLDAVDEVAVAALPRPRVIRSAVNLGFADANNLAAATSRAPWLATLNPDAYPEPDWLDRLMAATRRHPAAAMFASTLVDAAAPDRLDGLGDVYHASGLAWRGGHGSARSTSPVEGEVFSPCAAAALYRRDAFERAGGFDASYFCYLEDVDLGFRLRLAGGRCILVPDAVVRHVGSATTGRHSAFTTHHTMRNLAWTFIKDMPGPLIWLLPVHLAALAAMLGRAALRGQARAAARGLWDAVRGLRRVWALRRQVQAGRAVSWWCIARAVSWSPLAPARRAADIRAPIRAID